MFFQLMTKARDEVSLKNAVHAKQAEINLSIITVKAFSLELYFVNMLDHTVVIVNFIACKWLVLPLSTFVHIGNCCRHRPLHIFQRLRWTDSYHTGITK